MFSVVISGTSNMAPTSAACHLEQLLGTPRHGSLSCSSSSVWPGTTAQPRCGETVCLIEFAHCPRRRPLSHRRLEVSLKPAVHAAGQRAVRQRCLIIRDSWVHTCTGHTTTRRDAATFVRAALRPTRAQCPGTSPDQGAWHPSGMRLLPLLDDKHHPSWRRRVLLPPPPAPPPPAAGPVSPCILPESNWSCLGAEFFHGARLASMVPVADKFPVYSAGRRNVHGDHHYRIPRIVVQTGRGTSVQQHNGDTSGVTTALARRVAGRGWSYRWYNDSSSRAFVAAHCPHALAAYDCLVPKPFQADVFRYCALWTSGGVYYDAEDAPLEPLTNLVRPCDELVLVRDKCPTDEMTQYGLRTKALSILKGMSYAQRMRRFGRARGTAAQWKEVLARPLTDVPPCPHPAVQISFMAAVPRHPFFKCCLQLVVRNVRRRYYGPSDIFPTGPGLAGESLRKLTSRARRRPAVGDGGEPANGDVTAGPALPLNFTMELVQGVGGLYRLDGTAVIRTHAWSTRKPFSNEGWRRLCAKKETASAITRRVCSPQYDTLWKKGRMITANCSLAVKG